MYRPLWKHASCVIHPTLCVLGCASYVNIMCPTPIVMCPTLCNFCSARLRHAPYVVRSILSIPRQMPRLKRNTCAQWACVCVCVWNVTRIRIDGDCFCSGFISDYSVYCAVGRSISGGRWEQVLSGSHCNCRNLLGCLVRNWESTSQNNMLPTSHLN